MEKEKLWENILEELRETLSKPTYQTWFKDKTSLVNVDDGILTIGTLNSYAKDWLEKRYHQTIKKIVSRIVGKDLEITFKVDNLIEKNKPSPTPLFEFEEAVQATPIEKRIFESNLNPKYTFDNFVIGNNNRLAHAVSISVAKLPAKSYNPFFLYGGVGVGKTHLMQAIGHETLKTHPNLRVLYCTGESFTNEIIEAIQNRKTGSFRNKYRRIDVLLIDDIQFIAGRDTTQEEFFHTFNDLHSGGKQVVLSSDRPPKDIARLEERVRSRFEWGMVADIQNPDIDMREAILLSKCKEKNISLTPDILHYLAENVNSSIRDLEGSLTRLVTTSQLLGKPLDLELATQVILPQARPKTNKNVSPKEVIDVVCEYYSVKIADIKGARRSVDISRPRQIIMFLLRSELNLQYMGIARLLGGRDHSTIMHGVDKISKEVENNVDLSGQIGEIKSLIHQQNLV